MESMETLGERLKKLRMERGLTQEQLAGQLHVTRQAVAKWESDNGTPDVDNLVRLADAFGVTLDTLVGRAAAEEPSAPQSAIPVERICTQNERFGTQTVSDTQGEQTLWQQIKVWPHTRLVAALLFLFCFLIWLIMQVEIYEASGESLSWALALLAMIVSFAAFVANLVRYWIERKQKS